MISNILEYKFVHIGNIVSFQQTKPSKVLKVLYEEEGAMANNEVQYSPTGSTAPNSGAGVVIRMKEEDTLIQRHATNADEIKEGLKASAKIILKYFAKRKSKVEEVLCDGGTEPSDSRSS